MAASANRKITGPKSSGLTPPFRDTVAVAASVHVFQGSLVARDMGTTGRPARPASANTAYKVFGFADEEQDNSSGAQGDLKVGITAQPGWVANNGDLTTAHIGKWCFVVDDITVALSSNAGARPPAGMVLDVDDTYGVLVCPMPYHVQAALLANANGSTWTQTYSTANRTVAAPTAVVQTALTEAAGSIGGSNDGDLPDLTATYVARTGSNSGTANGALEAEGTLSTGNTYSDAAVNTILAKLENNIAEAFVVIGQLAADNVALRAAIREVAAKSNTHGTGITALVADDLDNRQSINALVDDVQALGGVG